MQVDHGVTLRYLRQTCIGPTEIEVQRRVLWTRCHRPLEFRYGSAHFAPGLICLTQPKVSQEVVGVLGKSDLILRNGFLNLPLVCVESVIGLR